MHLAQRNIQVKLGKELPKSVFKNVECILHKKATSFMFLVS
jgi:hypothetical protein